MTTSSLTCALSLTSETLSAWRDDLLPTSEAARVGNHVPTCAACQARLARFDRVATVLRRQRTLDPGDRVWSGVRARLSERNRGFPMVQHRGRIFGGLGALLIVIVLVVLFAQVLGNYSVTPAGTPTPSLSPTATSSLVIPGKTPGIFPTFTTVPTPNLPYPDPQSAWGNPTAAFSTQVDATHQFVVQSISADGASLLGYMATINNPSATGDAGFYDIASKQFTSIGVPPEQLGMGQPTCCLDDGRFLIAMDNDAPGATGSALHDRTWVYDRSTRQARLLSTGSAIELPSDRPLFDSDVFASRPSVTGDYQPNAVVVYALAAGTSQTITLTSDTSLSVRSVQLRAQNLYYIVTSNVNATSDSTLRVRNLTTGADQAVGSPISPADILEGVVAGDNLFYSMSSGTNCTLYEADNYLTSGARPQPISSYDCGAGSPFAVNDRLILVGSFGEFNSIAWDRVGKQFVKLPQIPKFIGGGTITVGKNKLVIAQAPARSPSGTISVSGPQTVQIYDTSALP